MSKFAYLTLFLTSNLLACPYCVGNGQGGKDSNTTLVLGAFILSTYIPYYIIFRLIKKHRNIKAKHDRSGSAIT